MRKSFRSSFSSPQKSQDSWFHRVAENLSRLTHSAKISPTSANGAPIHLLRLEGSGVIRRAQSASLLTHALLITVLGYLAFHPATGVDRPDGPATPIGRTLSVPHDLLSLLRGLPPSAGKGDGSGHDLLPTNSALLPPRSSIQLVKPMIPQLQHAEAPIPPTLLDPNAQPVLIFLENIGVPWTREKSDSSGIGRGNTMGDGEKDGDSIGDKDGDFAGNDPLNGINRAGMVWAKCAYCPNPEYTEEGRKQKVQGSVLLEVLVGTDGKAARIRLIRGLGLGLDVRAAETVRGWKFVPAHDASGKTVPTRVTIEAIFRLF